MKTIIQQKKQQRKYSDGVYASYFKKGWQKPYPKSQIGDFIDYYPLNNAISMLPFKIKGKKVLSICCGDGFEAEFLYKHGAIVTVTDISKEAVLAAKRRCPNLKGVAADSENLPFKDSSFDLVLVRDGLHHLPNPHKGISEMNRVGKYGFIMIEAQKSIIMEVLIKLKFALEYEISGNYVYRFTKSEIHHLMKEMKINNYKIQTLWCYHFTFLSKYVYPLFNHEAFLWMFKMMFYVFNTIFGYLGNSMTVVAIKDNVD